MIIERIDVFVSYYFQHYPLYYCSRLLIHLFNSLSQYSFISSLRTCLPFIVTNPIHVQDNIIGNKHTFIVNCSYIFNLIPMDVAFGNLMYTHGELFYIFITDKKTILKNFKKITDVNVDNWMWFALICESICYISNYSRKLFMWV